NGRRVRPEPKPLSRCDGKAFRPMRPAHRSRARRPARGCAVHAGGVGSSVAAGNERAQAAAASCARSPSSRGWSRGCAKENPMLRVSLLAVAVSAARCANASAADEQWQPTVQVTASRVEGTVGAALADVSVITREEIEASGAPDVLELLRLQSGIDLYRTGGAGQQT